MNELMTADERRDALLDLLTDSDDWNFAQWLSELMFGALERIESLMGPELSAAPLRQIVEPIAKAIDAEAETWRDVMDDDSAFYSALPISFRFREAVLYGYYGVTPRDVSYNDRANWLRALVRQIKSFAERSDVNHLNDGENQIQTIANLVSSRLAIDFGEGEVDLRSLALLGNVSEGRVRNLLSETNSPLERGPNGGIKALSAAAWLQKKKGFYASLWMAEETEIEEADNKDEVEMESITFVPVARDGSMFTPDLERNGSYRIGAKGEEENYENFLEALSRLNAMATPRWRRPNEKGIWGIVSGVAWQRIEMKWSEK